MKAEFFGKFELKDIVLIASLPDMGRVGGLVSSHIAKQTSAKEAAKITLSDKPWINQKDGIIESPTDEYKIFVDAKNSLVIFSGENQPQESYSVFDLVNFVVDTVQKWGNIKMVISTGGYLPMQTPGGESVYGVATSQKLLDELKRHGINLLPNDVKSITWFNGLILGAAKNKNIDGVGLFGEIKDPELPQQRSAKNIINKLEKILSLSINTDELNVSEKKPPESQKEGPGIG